MLKTAMMVGAAVAALSAVPSEAAQVILSPTAVIGSTGGFGSQFTPDNIVDQQTGTIVERLFDGSYWLNPDNRTGAFITLDLGSARTLDFFQLFNSRNQGDRGTADFEIRAGNALVAATGTATGATGRRLDASAKTIAAGTLSMDAGTSAGAALSPQTFNASDRASAYRYIEFRPLTASGGNGNNLAFGLNELRVFETDAIAAVPEPTTWAMMIGGFGMIGGMMRRGPAGRRAFV